MKNIFIINTVASSGKAIKLVDLIKELFPDCIFEFTAYKGHATEIASRYCDSDTKIYSVGGDGTINEIVNGMKDSKALLSIIPAGTGNDFFRSISDEKKPENVLRNDSSDEMSIDFGIVNNRRFLNVATVGLDAEIGRKANELEQIKFLPSSLKYNLSILSTLATFKFPKIRFTLNGETYEKRITIFAVCKGSYYGGGYNIAPSASLTGGMLDVCCIDDLPKHKIPFLIPDLKKGTHGKYPFVNFTKTDNVILEGENAITCNIDGEIIESDKYEFSVVKDGLRVVKPKVKTITYGPRKI